VVWGRQTVSERRHGDWRREGWRSQRGYCFSGQPVSVSISHPQLNLPSDTAVCVSRIHFRCLMNHYEDMYTHTQGVKCITWCLSSPSPLLKECFRFNTSQLYHIVCWVPAKRILSFLFCFVLFFVDDNCCQCSYNISKPGQCSRRFKSWNVNTYINYSVKSCL